MTLDKIFEMWKEDCEIDQQDLDLTSINTSKQHAKYLEILGVSKLTLKRREQELKILQKNKWLWYHGKLDKDQMDAFGWSYDPLNGLKILKGDMDKFFESDEDIQNLVNKVEYSKTVVSSLEEIISMIKWRHQTIKNIIEHRKFMSGI